MEFSFVQLIVFPIVADPDHFCSDPTYRYGSGRFDPDPTEKVWIRPDPQHWFLNTFIPGATSRAERAQQATLESSVCHPRVCCHLWPSLHCALSLRGIICRL